MFEKLTSLVWLSLLPCPAVALAKIWVLMACVTISPTHQLVDVEFFIVKTIRTKYIKTHWHKGENTLLHWKSILYLYLYPVHREVDKILIVLVNWIFPFLWRTPVEGHQGYSESKPMIIHDFKQRLSNIYSTSKIQYTNNPCFFLSLWQTRCSRGCPTNSLVIN